MMIMHQKGPDPSILMPDRSIAQLDGPFLLIDRIAEMRFSGWKGSGGVPKCADVPSRLAS